MDRSVPLAWDCMSTSTQIVAVDRTIVTFVVVFGEEVSVNLNSGSCPTRVYCPIEPLGEVTVYKGR